MSVLDFELGVAGISPQTLKDLNDHLPHLARLAAELKQAEPLINQLMPILNKAWPDIVAVTPLMQELIAFAKQKENQP